MTKDYKTAVVGAGTMGSGIAQKMAQEGLKVTLLDINKDNLQQGLEGIQDMLNQGLNRGVFTKEKVDATMERITGTTSYDDLKDVDLVVEAVFEDKEIKGKVFSKLDEVCDPETIIASNTSSFYINELAKNTDREDKFVGMHYFYHPAKNRLLEVIPHQGTSKDTAEKAAFIGKLHGKTVIMAKDSPGFVVNRFFIPYYVQSIRTLEEDIANIPTIEKAAKEAFGIGMGPFELINVTGVPIAVHSANTLKEECSNFYAPPKILKEKAEAEELWDVETGKIEEDKIEEVQELLYGTVFGVVCTMLDEDVASVGDIDRGAKVGLRWQKGPFKLINEIGVDKAYEYVEKICKRYPEFEMPEALQKQYELGQPFEFNFVDTTIEDNIANIKINRPEAMNALNDVIFEQLEEEFDKAEKNEDIRAIVIKSAGKEFVAGADIKYFVKNIKNDDIDKTVEFTKDTHDLFRRLETSSKPTIALVDGLSLGGGSELALACQAIVATPDASFGFPETGIGIYPGNGGMIRLARHVGSELTKYYVFTNKTITAEEADDLGIITELVDITEADKAIEKIISKGKFDKYTDRELPDKYNEIKKVFSNKNLDKLLNGDIPEEVNEEFADKMIDILSEKAPLALEYANEIIDKQVKVSIDEAIEIELSRLVDIFNTEDALKGLSNMGRGVEYNGK